MKPLHRTGWGDPLQRGIALLASLAVLSALSLLALFAMNSMLSQQRMAGNFGDAASARANATQARHGGEALLIATPADRRNPGCDSDCFRAPTDTLIYPAGALPALPEFENADWWQATGRLPGTDPVTAAPPPPPGGPWAEAPLFTLEEIAFIPAADILAPAEAPPIIGVGYYRILGRGTGQQRTAVAVHESIVARPWANGGAGQSPASEWAELCEPFRPWYDCGPMAWRARR